MKNRVGSPSVRSKLARIVLCSLAIGLALPGCRTRTNNENADVKLFGLFKQKPSPPIFDGKVTNNMACRSDWPLAETLTAKTPTRVYHWTNSDHASKQPWQYLSDLVFWGKDNNDKKDNPDGAAGGGLYGALDPFVSRDYGNILVSFEIKQGSRFASSLSTGRDRALKAYKVYKCPGVVYEFEESFVTNSPRAINLWDLSSVDPASVHVTVFGRAIAEGSPVFAPLNFPGIEELSREKNGEGQPLVQMASAWEYRNQANPNILTAIVFTKMLEGTSPCIKSELRKLSAADATTASKWVERFFINQTAGGFPVADWCARNVDNKDFKSLFASARPAPSLDRVLATVANACVPSSPKTASMAPPAMCADAIERFSTLKPSQEQVEAELKIIQLKLSRIKGYWSNQPSLKDW